MGKRKGRKKTRVSKMLGAGSLIQDKSTEEQEMELPPLSDEGLKAALGVAPLERIEEIRRA